MVKKEVYIIGAGSYGEAMFELALLCNYKPVGFFDDDQSKKGTDVMGIPVLGNLDHSVFSCKDKNFVVAIGNNRIRVSKMIELLERNAKLPTLIHPSADISKFANIDPIGCYIHANTYLWTKVQINRFCILSPGVIIAHHTVLNEGTFVSAGSNVGANIYIENNVFVGIGSTIMTGVTNIAKDSIIGAGSVVINNTEEDCTYAGIPAKKISGKNKSS